MGVYRIELSASSRAICQATHHKKAAIKIPKGALRLGVWVPYQESGSYKWRHWECVTPETLHNWHEETEDDMEMVDGYDELPEAAQEKVQRCLLQEHIDDEDFEGDLEMNRYSSSAKRGLFAPGSHKKKKFDFKHGLGKDPDAEESDNEDSKPKKKPQKRTKKQMKEEDDENEEVDEKPAKKARTKKTAAIKTEDDEDVESLKPTKKSRSKKAVVKTEETDDEVAEPTRPQTGRSRKATAVKKEESEDEAMEEAKPAPKRRAKKAAAAKPKQDDKEDAGVPEPKPAKRRGRPEKAMTKSEDLEEIAAPKAAAKNGRGKKAGAKKEEDTDMPDADGIVNDGVAAATSTPTRKPTNGLDDELEDAAAVVKDGGADDAPAPAEPMKKTKGRKSKAKKSA